jgi:hypothetical protein
MYICHTYALCSRARPPSSAPRGAADRGAPRRNGERSGALAFHAMTAPNSPIYPSLAVYVHVMCMYDHRMLMRISGPQRAVPPVPGRADPGSAERRQRRRAGQPGPRAAAPGSGELDWIRAA